MKKSPLPRGKIFISPLNFESGRKVLEPTLYLQNLFFFVEQHLVYSCHMSVCYILYFFLRPFQIIFRYFFVFFLLFQIINCIPANISDATFASSAAFFNCLTISLRLSSVRGEVETDKFAVVGRCKAEIGIHDGFFNGGRSFWHPMVVGLWCEVQGPHVATWLRGDRVP